MTDASVDYPYYLHHPHQQQHPHAHHKNKSSVTAAAAAAAGEGHENLRSRTLSGSIHKTWQLIIREVQSSDAGLYVSLNNI
jgi:hypothetical protein